MAAPANRRDDGLLAATLDALVIVGVLPAQPVVHLDAGDDWKPLPADAGRAPHAWRDRQPGDASPDPSQPTLAGPAQPRLGHQDGSCAGERRRLVVAFWLALANAAIVGGRLLRRAWACYRWEGRPRRRP